MNIVLALLLSLLRFTGYFIEPLLSDDDIHAVAGEPSRFGGAGREDRALQVVTWDIGWGVRFDRVAGVLARLDADVVLLQEADRFCARSGNRDVPRDLATALRMN